MATILIVDPDSGNAVASRAALLRLGHRPIGPREWVEGEEPDLLLLEPASRPGLRLPAASGGGSANPILCVSIDGPSGETIALGPAAHVMKPFRRSQLERRSSSALIPSRGPV